MEGANVGKQKRAIESPSGWGTRHTIVVVAALGNLLGYFLRVDMSVAIVAMVDQSERVSIFPINTFLRNTDGLNFRAGNSNNASLYGEECPPENATRPETNGGGTFQWDQSQQGLILSGYREEED